MTAIVDTAAPEGQRDSAAPLMNLRQWLDEQQLPVRRTLETVELIGTFLSDTLPQNFSCPVRVGMSAQRAEGGGHDLWLHLLWPKSLDLMNEKQAKRLNQLTEAFTWRVAIPLLPNPAVHLEHYMPNRCSGDFDDTLRHLCRDRAATYLGVFRTESCAPRPTRTS